MNRKILSTKITTTTTIAITILFRRTPTVQFSIPGSSQFTSDSQMAKVFGE
jgi:hypothetical protein